MGVPIVLISEGQGHPCISLDLEKHVNISQGSRERGELNNDLVSRAKEFTVASGGELIH